MGSMPVICEARAWMLARSRPRCPAGQHLARDAAQHQSQAGALVVEGVEQALDAAYTGAGALVGAVTHHFDDGGFALAIWASKSLGSTSTGSVIWLLRSCCS